MQHENLSSAEGLRAGDSLLCFAFFLIGALMISTPHAAQSTAAFVPQPSVTVDGSSRTVVQPDEVVFSLGISTTSPELQQARRENAERTKRVVEALRTSGIAEKDIRTENVRAHREYEWTNRERIFRGFQVNRTITVVLRDLQRFEDVLSALLETTEVDLHSTDFRYSKLRELDLQIRQEAVADAQRKAAAMAEQLGQRIGRAVQIVDASREDPGRPVPQQMRMMAAEAAPSQEPITAPGEIEVQARVTVTFLLD